MGEAATVSQQEKVAVNGWRTDGTGLGGASVRQSMKAGKKDDSRVLCKHMRGRNSTYRSLVPSEAGGRKEEVHCATSQMWGKNWGILNQKITQYMNVV